MDPRIERTRAAILGAVTELVEQQPLAEITITQAAGAAGVTRPTFYQHFPDVLSAARAAVFAQLEDAFPYPEPLPPDRALTNADIEDRISRHALPLLNHLEAHREFFVRVMDQAGTSGFFDDLIAFAGARLLPDLIVPANSGTGVGDMGVRFFAGGLTWLVINWLRSSKPVPAAQMAGEIAALVASLARR